MQTISRMTIAEEMGNDMNEKELRDFKPVEMEVTKSKKQEILIVRLEAYDFSRGRFTCKKCT